MLRTILLVSLLGAAGCQGCVTPNIPTETEVVADSGEIDEDSGDTGPDDTSPPPPCDVPEVEPNSIDAPQTLPLEQWACGEIGQAADIDAFRFIAPDAGWYKIEVRSEQLGAEADLRLFADDDDLEMVMISNASRGTYDPEVVFPLEGPTAFTAWLQEIDSLSGEDYFWEMLVSEVKPPLSWISEETEPNDTISTPEPIASGDLVYGILSRNDRDWFTFEVETDRASLTAEVQAWQHGSPLDARLQLWFPGDEDVDEGVTPEPSMIRTGNSLYVDPRYRSFLLTE
ncbi:MAG: hypothetical protein AAFV53_31910, partial [Myxococcota bacterium]